MTRRVLLPLLLLALAACSQSNTPTTEAPAAAATTAMPASADEPAATATTAPAAASTAAVDPAADAAAAQALAADPSGLVEGRDYETIKDGAKWKADDKIEVVEVFGYVCPACAAFDPIVESWKARLPADVRFSYVPAPFGPEWNPYAKAFYVAESMNLVDRTHRDLIREIHITQAMPGEGDGPDEQKIAEFYAKYGANPKEFLSTMNSFSINAQVAKGRQFMIRSGANSTPTLIVNGKYRVTGNSFEDMVRIASGLIARERAAAGAAAAPAAAATKG
jgi:thiol:disulfide interchange protein DsbA